jgi:hypothetical protein
MCATRKPSNKKMGLYVPLPIPSHPWESVYMDFVRGLLMSWKGHAYLYVVLDRFIKMCVLVPCKKHVTRENIAHLFFQHVWVHFGFLASIIFDRDSCFLGDFGQLCWG